jgi:hypothetical protein
MDIEKLTNRTGKLLVNVSPEDFDGCVWYRFDGPQGDRWRLEFMRQNVVVATMVFAEEDFAGHTPWTLMDFIIQRVHRVIRTMQTLCWD